MTDIPFEKYDIGGAYHWKWYMVDFQGYRRFVDRLVNLFPASGRVLDVGCGDGLISYALFHRGFEVVGIDVNPTALRLAEDICVKAAMGRFDDALRLDVRPGVHPLQRIKDGALSFRRQSAEEVDDENAFDYVLCAEVVEHVPAPEHLVSNVHRAMRNFAVITTPDGRFEEPGPYDYQLWTPEEFDAFLSPYRFEHLALRDGTIAVKLYKM